MHVIYISTLCSDRKFIEIFDMCDIKPVQQGQKYTGLLVSGFAHNEMDVTVVSAYPINRSNTKQLLFKKEEEYIGSIRYIYMMIINVILIRHIFLLIQTATILAKLCKKHETLVVIVDGLNTSLSLSAAVVCKVLKKKLICTITDIPIYMHSMVGRLVGIKKIANFFVQKVFSFVVNNSHGLILVTEQMAKLVKKEHQKSIVIEGIVDINMTSNNINLRVNHGKKVCLYSGALHEIYGIKMLVHAFIEADIQDCEMHFYGDGDCNEYLTGLVKRYDSIKYFGSVHNKLVVKEQMKATLLINPRPTNEKYTEYSFPSKNMEYMVSGTPVLTTKLIGMPDEYLDHVYLIKDETVKGLADELRSILSKPLSELQEKGVQAKEFVLMKKNNVVQAQKVINMAKSIL